MKTIYENGDYVAYWSPNSGLNKGKITGMQKRGLNTVYTIIVSPAVIPDYTVEINEYYIIGLMPGLASRAHRKVGQDVKYKKAHKRKWGPQRDTHQD